ncbi:MAG TPA: serine/threonine-protein kinase [Holophagaceae bacterium]|nr:serine/threonine-protein kinase [Holophagaceae bacterium]
MPLAPGTRLGLFEILSPLGAGGMGEVYKARDPKLDRWVALKVLPASMAQDPDLLARFEREAKAVAALNHPNILGIYDFGKQDRHVYAVMELLEGESLRERLKAGPLPPKKAVEIGLQVAEGLAAAHAKGIIHRDIKPENIFLTREGRVKVLDFGLSKQIPAWAHSGSPHSEFPTQTAAMGRTEAGAILGTAGYMAPEQVRGEAADHRSDIFAFGSVLFEMLTGHRAFERDTAVQTFKAVLVDEPAEFASLRPQISPALERLVLHCLEKEAGRRFQSMQDLAYGLRQLDLTSAPPQDAEARSTTPRDRRWLAFAAGAASILLLGLLLATTHRLRLGEPPPPPSFQRLNFVPGTLEAARFGPDGRSVYFSQRIAGGKPEIFVARPGTAGPEPVGLQDALLLGVSATNELAFLNHPRHWVSGRYRGTLARAPGGGGALRELQENVTEVAWDGEGLATVTSTEQEVTLEFPPGNRILRDNHQTRTLCLIRLSPDRAHLALVDADARTKTQIVVFTREGQRRALFTQEGDINGNTLTGLAWGPGGELWVSELQGDQTALWALDMNGRRRPLWRGQGHHQLMDVSPRGQALLVQHQARRGVWVQRVNEDHPRDLSILGSTQAFGLSADGRNLLLLESPAMDGGTSRDEAYLRPVDGGPPVRLGRGTPDALSPDGRWVHMDTATQKVKDIDPGWLAAYREAGLPLQDMEDPKARARYALFVPTGLGRPLAVPLPKDSVPIGYAFLFPDGQRVLASLSLRGKDHWVLLDRKGQAPQVVTREGLADIWAGLVPLSPDGSRLIVSGTGHDWFIQPLPGGEPKPIPGLLPRERVIGWSGDGKAVFVRPELSVLPVALTRVELATGARKQVLAFTPPDAAGQVQTRGVFMSLDAKVFAFTYEKKLSELYLVEGLK